MKEYGMVNYMESEKGAVRREELKLDGIKKIRRMINFIFLFVCKFEVQVSVPSNYFICGEWFRKIFFCIRENFKDTFVLWNF
jgi:hypothetical protein